MATNAEKYLSEVTTRLILICKVNFTEEVKNKFFPKFKDDENFKNKIEESYRFIVELWKNYINLETIDEKARQIVRDLITEVTIEEYTNEVYEILCRIAVLEEVKDDIASLEQFYEESISVAKAEYVGVTTSRLNHKE